MKPIKLALLFALTFSPGAALAQDAISNAIKARQAQMTLYAFNIGQLGAMAKGAMPYDAATAQAAADNLVHMTSLHAAAMWVADSDEMSADNTRALPALWENFPDVIAKSKTTADAALVMQAAAGTGVDGIRSSIGALGQACGACHKAYRAPKN